MACTAWNNAIDPQGNHDSGTSSMTVHIDEAPPALSLEPVNPNDPTGLVADTSDSESGVAGGSIEIAPAGSSIWTALPTAFSGTQLLAHFDDADARPVRVQGAIVRQRRQLRINHPDADAASARPAISEVSLAQLPATRCPGAAVKHTGDRIVRGRSGTAARAMPARPSRRV